MKLQKPIFPTRSLSRYLYQNAIFTWSGAQVMGFWHGFLSICFTLGSHKGAGRSYVAAFATQKLSLKFKIPHLQSLQIFIILGHHRLSLVFPSLFQVFLSYQTNIFLVSFMFFQNLVPCLVKYLVKWLKVFWCSFNEQSHLQLNINKPSIKPGNFVIGHTRCTCPMTLGPFLFSNLRIDTSLSGVHIFKKWSKVLI